MITISPMAGTAQSRRSPPAARPKGAATQPRPQRRGQRAQPAGEAREAEGREGAARGGADRKARPERANQKPMVTSHSTSRQQQRGRAARPDDAATGEADDADDPED